MTCFWEEFRVVLSNLLVPCPLICKDGFEITDSGQGHSHAFPCVRAQSVHKPPQTLASFPSNSPLAALSLSQLWVSWGVGQVEVRDVALCIHKQDRVLLSYVPLWGMAPTRPGHGPLWFWEPADWHWDGLTWALALLWTRQGGAAQCFVAARGSHGSLGTEHCTTKVGAGREIGAKRPYHPEPSFLQIGSELWQVSRAVKPGILGLSSASHNPTCLGQGGKGLGKPSQPTFHRSPEARGWSQGL